MCLVGIPFSMQTIFHILRTFKTFATAIAATADRPYELTGNFSLMRYLDIEMF